jgi:hypothetical protein
LSRAQELLAQYQTKIAKSGQWIAIRRYTGPVGPSRPWTDTLARAYVRYYSSKELIGSIVQGDVAAISLVDTLGGILPVTTTDKLILGFDGFDVPGTTPTLVGAHVSNGKETTIKNPMKRTPGGTLIAIEIHAAG